MTSTNSRSILGYLASSFAFLALLLLVLPACTEARTVVDDDGDPMAAPEETLEDVLVEGLIISSLFVPLCIVPAPSVEAGCDMAQHIHGTVTGLSGNSISTAGDPGGDCGHGKLASFSMATRNMNDAAQKNFVARFGNRCFDTDNVMTVQLSDSTCTNEPTDLCGVPTCTGQIDNTAGEDLDCTIEVQGTDLLAADGVGCTDGVCTPTIPAGGSFSLDVVPSVCTADVSGTVIADCTGASSATGYQLGWEAHYECDDPDCLPADDVYQDDDCDGSCTEVFDGTASCPFTFSEWSLYNERSVSVEYTCSSTEPILVPVLDGGLPCGGPIEPGRSVRGTIRYDCDVELRDAAGTYFIRVENVGGGEVQDYELDMDVDCTLPACDAP